jgi:hypothetical protein
VYLGLAFGHLQDTKRARRRCLVNRCFARPLLVNDKLSVHDSYKIPPPIQNGRISPCLPCEGRLFFRRSGSTEGTYGSVLPCRGSRRSVEVHPYDVDEQGTDRRDT